MKRIIVTILAIAIFLSTLLGCVVTTADTALKMGEWVTLIANAFGMQNYTEETPYFENVSSDDSSFAAFQMAAEWDIIEPSDTISSSTPVTWNDALISLVNAGEFLDNTATDKEKIDYAIDNFDSSIRTYWGNRYITLEEAVPLLETAQDLWANKVFTEKIETVSFSDSVIDYIDNTTINYENQDDVIISDSEELKTLQVGDVYTLPANDSNSASINKVKSIEFIDGYVVITNDEDFLEDEAMLYIEEMTIQATESIDFTNITGIYDEDGNPIEFEIDDSTSTLSSSEYYQTSTLAYNTTTTQTNTEQTGIFSSTTPIKIRYGEWSFSISFKENGLSIQVSKETSKTTMGNQEYTTEVYGKVTFEDIQLTSEVDISWFTLNSATVRLDYKTTIEGGSKNNLKNEIGSSNESGNNITALSEVIGQYKDALTTYSLELQNSLMDDEEIYICRLSLAEGGLASVDFIIKGKVTSEGEWKFVIEVEGGQGIQYKNGNLRYIKSTGVEVDFVADGGVELTISPGFAFTILKKIALAELTIDLGAGATVGTTAHLFDYEGHELFSVETQLSAEDANDLANEELYTTAEELAAFAEQAGGYWDAEGKGDYIALFKGVCLDWNLYPIVRISIGAESVVGKLAKKLNVSVSFEIKGKGDTILSGHIDFPNNISSALDSDSIVAGMSALLGVGASCTYDYTPWDGIIDETDETELETESSEIITTAIISLSTVSVTLQEGESQNIKVTGLPEGYELQDLIVESEDTDIVDVYINEGVITITGKTKGSTKIIVSTSNGNYKSYCAVTVTSEEQIDFNELS